jgi:UDP-GlcNAc:undecaprenyl-phosphate/decaprenyl-phosphate GlcNAc-1-phosphate transferase
MTGRPAPVTAWRSAAAGLAAGAAGTAAAWVALRARPPGGAALWERTNHRGDPLTLLEGPALAVGAAAAVALVPGLPAPARTAGLIALAGAGAFGAVDDLREDGNRKGLRGHLGELAHGRVTTGGLKVLGIGATGVLAAACASRPVTTSRAAAVIGVGLSGAVVAASANLVNLLDLRPGRALKAVLLGAGPVIAGRGATRSSVVLGSVAAGAASALLRDDLNERAMLGDTGANAAGALLGVAALHRLGPRGQAGLLAVLTGLTLISERVSFTAVIESTPGLRELDALGRSPR